MTPTLARRGRLIATAGALFIGAGAFHPDSWPLVALGVVILSSLCTAYLWFYPTAIFLRRHKVELAWWVPPGDQPGGAVTVDRPFALHIALRNRGHRPLRVASARVLASSPIEGGELVAVARVPAGHEVELLGWLRSSACGHWVLHGAQIQLGDALGLFEIRAYFPNPIGVQVFPKSFVPRSAQAIRPQVGALHERLGLHSIRRRGLAGDLREIRDHAHGDPFKLIAWKATARRRRLMVRDLDSEIVVTHQILVDIGGSMRAPAGRSKLGYAIETAAALARAALERGDRVGLITYDTRIFGQVKPGEGHPHFLKLVGALLETQNVVDSDLTDVTDGELCAAVARYLLQQEGVDVRISRPPALSDPAWARLAAGPAGELYDLGALREIVSSLLAVHASAVDSRRGGRALPGASSPPTDARLGGPSSGGKAPPNWWSRILLEEGVAREGPSPDMARLRLFARVRGLELPYLSTHVPGDRTAGLGEALARATAAERSQLVVLISDLEAVLDDPAGALAAVARARRRHHHVFGVAPLGPAFLRPPAGETARRVVSILADDERRRLEEARRQLVRAGVPVVVAGPEDTPDALARRLANVREVRYA